MLHSLTYEEQSSSASQLATREPMQDHQISELTLPQDSQPIDASALVANKPDSTMHPKERRSFTKEINPIGAEKLSTEDTEFLRNVSTNAIDYFVKHLPEYKNGGKIELFHVFSCESYFHLKEVLKVFIKNLTLNVLVTQEIKEKDLSIIEENSWFAIKGVVIASKSSSLDNEDRTLQKFSHFLLPSLLAREGKPDNYIFSMNHEQPQKSDYNMGIAIANHASKSAPSKTFPFKWYLFGFNLYKYMVSHNVSAISISKNCMELANSFDMNKEQVEAALVHLTENNVILCFRDILEDTVFVGANKFALIFYDLFHNYFIGRQCTKIDRSEFNLTVQPYAEGFVSADDLVMLFTKLMILIPLDDDFIFPCFLPLLNEAERKKVCTSFTDPDIIPLYIECPTTGYEFISMLTVFLATVASHHWDFFEDKMSDSPVCLSKNCVVFVSEKDNFIITISFSGRYIQVNLKSLKSSQKDVSFILTKVLQGLEKIRLALKPNELFDFRMSFKCSCEDQSFHTAYYDNENDKLICGWYNKSISITHFHRRWIKSG